MITKMRPRYYCEHCKKSGGNPSLIKYHEIACVSNPNRVCGMCRHVNEKFGWELHGLSVNDTVSILDNGGFAALEEAVSGCPSCILSAVRTKNKRDEDGNWFVDGPKDGREKFDFRSAKIAFWGSFDSVRDY